MEYETLASLPLSITGVETTRLERETSNGFTRVTTEITLYGPDIDDSELDSRSDGRREAAHETNDDETTAPADRALVSGTGEDVTYEADEHDRFPDLGAESFDLAGSYTFGSFADHLGTCQLFPAGDPDRDVFRAYRRWGIESAALELALAQSNTDLATVVGRRFKPVRFVASTRLGDPPTLDRVNALRERVPDLELKLDPTPEWDDAIIDALAETGSVRVLDLKGQYEGTTVDVEADPDLYRRLFEAFPDAVIEDPAVTPATRALLEAPDVRTRISWDAPIHGLEDVLDRPWEPQWLNVKPSRFGSLSSLLETIAYCEDRGIAMYGGGQFELGVGRAHIQALASLWYPDAPNDVAPGVYNAPTAELDASLPESPLEPPIGGGFGWE